MLRFLRNHTFAISAYYVIPDRTHIKGRISLQTHSRAMVSLKTKHSKM